MANYQLLKADIDAKVYENAYREITGENLNSVLNAMVTTLGEGYQFAGVATKDTNPEVSDAKVFYIANGKGTYTNFGGINVTEDDVVVLYWDTAWHKVATGIASQAKLSELDSEVNGNNPSFQKTLISPSSSYTNVFFDEPIKEGLYIMSINNEQGSYDIGGYLIKPDGGYYDGTIASIDYIKQNIPYKLDKGELGGIKLSGIGDVVVTFSDGSEEKYGIKQQIGNLSELHTDDKSSLVNAINEIKDNSGSTTDLIFDTSLNKNQQTINQEVTNDIKDIKSTINGNNPYGTRSITAPGGSGYSNVFFDTPIPSGYTITAIDGNKGGYFIQPDGSYVEVILLSTMQLPYTLPSECGGIKVTGNGETIVTFSNNTEEKKGLQEQIDDVNEELSVLKNVPLIHIPSTIYAVVNDTIQLFYKSIIECNDIDNYYVRIDGEGASYPRYHEVKPTSVGNKPMNVQVFDQNGNIIASREFTLNVVSQPKNPLSKTNIAFFGDSLTEGGQYPIEVKRMLTSNDAASGIMPQGKALGNIELVGLMQKSNANYYGIGGWGWNNYALNTDSGVRFYTQNLSSVLEGTRYTINGVTIQATTKRTTDMSFSAKLVGGSRENIPSSGTFDGTSISYTSVADDTSNPLWDGSKVSFVYYFNQCGMTGNVGIISFLLGWNIVYMNFSEYTEMIRTLITTAHQEYPTARFALVGIQCPSNNGGLANNYLNDRFFSNKQEVIAKMHKYNEYLMDIANEYDYVDYIDTASQFDSDNNMPEEQINVNTRNEKKEWRGNNGVHPSINGYYQIADVMYRYIVAKLCQ